MKGRKFNQQSVKSAERKETTVRGGGLKKAYRSPVTLLLLSPCVCCLSLSIHKKGVIFGALWAWTDLGQGQGCLIAFDSSACTRTTRILCMLRGKQLAPGLPGDPCAAHLTVSSLVCQCCPRGYLGFSLKSII